MDDDATAFVTKPRVLAIGPFAYRTNLPPLDDEVQPYMDGLDHGAGSNSSAGIDTTDIETLESGFVRCAVDVPRALQGLVIGKGGAVLKRIQQETGAHIQTPPKRGKSTRFIIEAETIEKLDSARTRLQLAMDDAANKCAPTHFVSIPLLDPQLLQNVAQFKQDVLHNCLAQSPVSALRV